MDTVILYSETLEPKRIAGALADLNLRPVASRALLAEAVVREPDILAVIIQVGDLDGPLERFLSSLRRSIPRLNVAVICGSCREALPELFTQIDLDVPDDTLMCDVQNFVLSAAITNRRRANRFDWPLNGYLSFDDGKRWQTHRVRSLGRGGAFLESENAAPAPGARAAMRIVFQDFKMRTACEVLDSRSASSNLPAGFGVRFTGFSESSCQVIDRIVDDALVRTLIAPEETPAVPSLGAEEGLSISPELT